MLSACKMIPIVRQGLCVSAQNAIMVLVVNFRSKRWVFRLMLYLYITLLGLVSSVLSIINFARSSMLKTGCGIYLLMSSITFLITIIYFTLKSWLLLFAQMGVIANRSFLPFYCMNTDYLFRVFVIIVDWLNACVVIERTITIIKGSAFNKNKSKRATKWVTACIVIFATSTSTQDILYRGLVDDKEEKRVWCLARYPPSTRALNSALISLQYLPPFLINFVSAVTIIIMVARRRSTSQKQLSYRQHLRLQFRQHKHLLISSLSLMTIALPRLITTTLSSCMKSSRNLWLFLIGYSVPFIAPFLTFVVFILPSKVLRQECRKVVKCVRT